MTSLGDIQIELQVDHLKNLSQLADSCLGGPPLEKCPSSEVAHLGPEVAEPIADHPNSGALQVRVPQPNECRGIFQDKFLGVAS